MCGDMSLQPAGIRPAVADAIGHRPHEPSTVGLAKCSGNAAHVSLPPAVGSRSPQARRWCSAPTAVVDTDVSVALVGPAQLVLDTKAPCIAHDLALVVVVEELHDCPGVGRYVAALDVRRSPCRPTPGSP